MKILYFTDTHIRGNTPKNRKDVFIDTLEDKFNEIIEIIKRENIDYVLHGGDLFDRPDISISIVSRFAKILNRIEVPFYLVSGNHDVYGYNPDTINRTMLGLLDTLKVVKIIKSDEKVILEKNGLKVQLTGKPYIYDIDNSINKDNYILEEVNSDVDFAIHMVHGMLLDKPFIKGIPYTLIEDIVDTKADITLVGHYHSGFKTVKIDNKYFVNPGSIVRITNSLREMDRPPQVAIIELDKEIDIRLLPLKRAKPGHEILDREEIEKSIFKRERMFEFKQTIDSASNFDKMDINDILIQVSNAEGVEEEVKEEALKRIAEVQMKGLNGD